jgi:hypothetical protein
MIPLSEADRLLSNMERETVSSEPKSNYQQEDDQNE